MTLSIKGMPCGFITSKASNLPLSISSNGHKCKTTFRKRKKCPAFGPTGKLHKCSPIFFFSLPPSSFYPKVIHRLSSHFPSRAACFLRVIHIIHRKWLCFCGKTIFSSAKIRFVIISEKSDLCTKREDFSLTGRRFWVLTIL